jgi:hypothetical protein
MTIWEQAVQFLGKPATYILTIGGLITLLVGFVAFVVRHYDLVNRQIPELKEQVSQLETDLGDAEKERDELRRSIEDTDVLLKAIATIPGEIRQITRDVFISYDEDRTSTITQTVDGQTFQWRITVKQDENGRYSAMVGHRLFGSTLPAPEETEDEKMKELHEAMRSGIDQMGLFINAAERIDLSSREPQQFASAESISSVHPPPETGLEIYLVIERNEDENRRWRCALIAAMRK